MIKEEKFIFQHCPLLPPDLRHFWQRLLASKKKIWEGQKGRPKEGDLKYLISLRSWAKLGFIYQDLRPNEPIRELDGGVGGGGEKRET